MPVICFFGPDGSGKTTLATRLARKLTDEGYTVKLSWMRGTHTFASVLAEFLSRFNVFYGVDNPYYMISIPKSFKRPWQLLEFISFLPILITKFLVPNSLGYSVIAERYIPDFIAWVTTTTQDLDYTESIEAKFLVALSSKAEMKVYLTAKPSELLRRRCEYGEEFLSEQITVYERIAKSIRAYKLDTTSKNIEESLREVMYCRSLAFKKHENDES